MSGFDVLVKNELLAEVLNALPERKRDIVLLSYFLDMSDAEIGELLNVVRTTVFRHRKVGPGVTVVSQEQGVVKSIFICISLEKELLVMDGVGFTLPLVFLTEPSV